jgi:Putative Actinobacterial Holin-X, holin superfamily III
MPTRAPDATNGSLGDAAKHVADHASTIAKLELELATLELKKKVTVLGIGIGLGAGAALFAFFMVGFLFATLGAVLAIWLPTWAALLIVTGLLGVLAAICGLLAKGRIAKATPPVPEQAIEEAKLTSEALKS